MDVILSEFVARTSADPGLATDLLDAHDWNLHSALSAYYVMKGILPGEVPPSEAEIAEACGRSHSDEENASGAVVRSSSSRPPLVKLQAFDFDENDKKLTRGISRATDNFTLVSQARKEFAEDFVSVEQGTRPNSQKLEVPEYSFSLPDFSVFPDNLREYLKKDLIETATLVSLEQAGRLNWWHFRKISRKLWPLSTTGDGNCLLHAASLGMWGFHDRLLTLRKALHSLLVNSTYTDAFYRRWRWQTAMQNKQAGLIYCEEEWEREWRSLLKLSSSEPRYSNGQKNSSEGYSSSSGGSQSSSQSDVYESLEELHVLALAHVLRRAVVVIADTVLRDVRGEPLAPIPFGGIYLPLECPAHQRHPSPLCLTFDSAHFSALVPMDEEATEGYCEQRAAIPVTDPENRLLPLQFAVDPGPEVRWGQDEEDPWLVARLTLTDKEKLALLAEHLRLESVELPQDALTINGHQLQEEEGDSSPDRGMSCTGGKSRKGKAAKQLQTVAKQFGSIGRSMSKKLKSMARRGGSFKGEPAALKSRRALGGLPALSKAATVDGPLNPRQAVVALLDTDRRSDYQKRLIQNYLSSAIGRYEAARKYESGRSCVNPGCGNPSDPSTCYLCPGCYEKQRRTELELIRGREPSTHGAVVVSGKSAFYTEVDGTARESVGKLPTAGIKNSVFYDEYRCDNGTSDFKCPPSEPHPVVLKTIEESSAM